MATGVAIDCGGAGVVPPGWVCEDEDGRTGGRRGWPLTPASAQETDAQTISAPKLNAVATAPPNICWLRMPMPKTNAPSPTATRP